LANRIEIRRDTSTNWNSVNPILLQGELGLELNTNKLKIGDGILHWNALPYFGEYSGDFGNITTSTGSVINISGGAGSVLGAGVSISINVASGTVTGVLSSSDWIIFNNKYSGLPSQAGKTGKFLMSNGVTESWQDAPVDASASLNKSFVVGMAVSLGGM
jgi:hypothetical protein